MMMDGNSKLGASDVGCVKRTRSAGLYRSGAFHAPYNSFVLLEFLTFLGTFASIDCSIPRPAVNDPGPAEVPLAPLFQSVALRQRHPALPRAADDRQDD